MIRCMMATVAAVLLLASAALPAQDADRAAQFEQRMDELKTRLDLSDEQFDRLAPVMKNSLDAQRGILANYGIDLESRGSGAGTLGPRQARAMQQELERARSDTLASVEGILDAGQLAEFKRIQEERKAEMRERIRGRR